MSRSTRRDLTTTVLACAVGGGLALFAGTRTWMAESISRPAPLPPAQVAHTGAALSPWLTALGLVGLAGAGALLAVRGRARPLLGVLLLASGAAVVAGGGHGVAVAQPRYALWPLLCVLGGGLIGYAGLRALLRGASWPALGSRYERPVAEPVETVERGGPSRSDVAMWDALDRGEDPTGRAD
jgi:LPXTG-motif cell wall-anchored protein